MRLRGSLPFLLTAFLFGASSSGRAQPPGIDQSKMRLRDAVETAVRQNPELAALSHALEAAEGRAVQSRLRPNPAASALVEDIAGSGEFKGAGQSQATLEIAQRFELGGKREARGGAANAAVEIAGSELAVRRASLAAEVARRFVAVLAAELAREVAHTDGSLLAEMLQGIRRRVKAAAASELEQLKGGVALSRARLEEEHAEHGLLVARQALAVSMGDDRPSFAGVEGDLFERSRIPEYETLIARIDDAPEVARRLSEARLREAELARARANAVPDVTLAGGIRRLEGPDEQALLFGVSLPIPVFDRNQGAIREAEALTDQAGRERDAVRLRLRGTVFALYQELRHEAIRLDRLEGEILDAAEHSLSTARRGYDLGTFSVLDLLDASRTLNEVRRERVDAAAAYHRLRLEIASALGMPLGSDFAGGEL